MLYVSLADQPLWILSRASRGNGRAEEADGSFAGSRSWCCCVHQLETFQIKFTSKGRQLVQIAHQTFRP